ncbi:MAG: hypothetical protein I8H75_00110 [Myxococcaceae bacterium]|nr:hypothetical protein [Myxococcaceae bacterium]MBH2005748.1 hypothetical protein [Myxococcaceae bacterium]
MKKIILLGVLTGTIGCGNQTSNQVDGTLDRVCPPNSQVSGADASSKFAGLFMQSFVAALPRFSGFFNDSAEVRLQTMNQAIAKLQDRLPKQAKYLGRTMSIEDAQKVGDALRILANDQIAEKFDLSDFFSGPVQNPVLRADLIAVIDALYPPGVSISTVSQGILSSNRNARKVFSLISTLGSPSSNPCSRSLAGSFVALYGTKLDSVDPNGSLKKAFGLAR